MTTENPFTLMGILNVTPDSFFDGGRYFSSDSAVAHARTLLEEGADIIDIGGASSRPGATPVSVEDECRRVVPVVRAVVEQFGAVVSVDTTSAQVAELSVAAGAQIINDVSAGRHDPKMTAVAAEAGCGVIIMHSRGTSETMAELTSYDDVVGDALQELMDAAKQFCCAGVQKEQLMIDPGIGFAKTVEQNLILLSSVEQFVATGFPVLLGTSRKSFIGAVTGCDVEERMFGSLGSIAAAFLKGVRIFRVHDVGATRHFLNVMAAINNAES